MVSCEICCEIRGNTLECPVCRQAACVDCVYHFMKETPNCMFCREIWSIEQLRRLFPKTKAVTLIKTKLFHDFNSRINTHYDALVLQHTHHLNMRNEIEQLKLEKIKLKESLGHVTSRLTSLRNQLSHPDAFSSPPPFTPCGVFGCRGVQDTTGECTICLMSTCEICHESKTGEHVCDPGVIQSVSTITATCKPCPVCKVNISKVDGCDQMWCTNCKYGYSWKTGQLIKETSAFHNPHYFEEIQVNVVSVNIDHITIGKLRAVLMKLRKYDQRCEMEQISRILNVRKNITELGFEYARFTRLSRGALEREKKIQIHYLLSNISNDKLKTMLYRTHILIKRYETLSAYIIEYTQPVSKVLIELYDNLNTKFQSFDITGYYVNLRVLTEMFGKKAKEFEEQFNCMFPFYTTETLLTQYIR
jgi:hypothetical protein